MSGDMKHTKPATMREVAELAGVSQSTVSRVLSQKRSTIPISQTTQKKVLDAIEKLGYRPNLTARSLRTQRTYLIAVMIADISNPFYHFIVRAIQEIAHKRGYDVLISNTDHLYDNERHFCETVMRRPVDGAILIPYHLTSNELDELIEQTGTVVAVLAQYIDHPQVDVVYTDDQKGTEDAVRLLIEKGHHRIGYIGVMDKAGVGTRRGKGYMRALESAGIPIDPALIQEGDFSAESGRFAMRKLLELPNPPTAVFACNDLMALGAIDAALNMGWRVPEDVAVMGFDNIPEGKLIRPYLTTVAQKPLEIGKNLIQVVLDRIEGKMNGTRCIIEVPYEIVERHSA